MMNIKRNYIKSQKNNILHTNSNIFNINNKEEKYSTSNNLFIYLNIKIQLRSE